MSAHPDSRWTHTICDDCWYIDHHTTTDEGIRIEMPSRIAEDVRGWDQCCDCGSMTCSGIFVRRDPAEMSWCMENPATASWEKEGASS